MSNLRTNLTALFTVALVAVSTFLSSGASVAADVLKLRIAVAAAAPDTWPVFVGIEKGFFEKHGLDLKANTGVTSGPEAIRVMQAGDADLGAAGAGPVAAARSRGVPLTLVVLLSGGYGNDEVYTSISREGRGIRPGKPEDFKGKRIGVTFGTTPHEQLLKILDRAKVPLESVTLINIKPTDIAVALEQGSVDAVGIWEPNATHILANVKGSFLVTRGGGYVSNNAGIAVLDSVLKDKREAVKRLVDAFADTTQWMRNNSDATAEIGTRWTAGLELPIAKKALVHLGFDPRISKGNVKGVEETLAFLVDKKLLDKSVDVNSMVDASLIAEIMKESPKFFSDLKPIAAGDMLK